MIPKRVTLENFLSFGPVQEIIFDQDEVLWYISGPNGCGKSAIFDAMTYCLFGTHRASDSRVKNSDNNLIRHGENSFSVGFEFEFAGSEYRLHRGRAHSTRQPTPTAELRKPDGEWERIPNVNSVKELNEWVEKTLGLDSEQFQASVLLRQGKADAFVDAKPKDRFEILKGILNMEEYEKLADLVNEKKKVAVAAEARLTKQRDLETAVTAEQVAQAAEAETHTLEVKQQSDEAMLKANTLKGQAAQWNKKQQEQASIQANLNDVKALQEQADEIEQHYSRWQKLKDALPRLKTLFDIRQKLDTQEPLLQPLVTKKAEIELQHQQQTETLQKLEHDWQQAREEKAQAEAKAPVQQQARVKLQQCIEAAINLAKLHQQLSVFPPSLAKEIAKAKELHGKAVYAHSNARDEVARINGLLEVAVVHRDTIKKMKVGVKCSACGQPVTAEHAKKEKKQAEEQVEQLEGEQKEAQKQQKACDKAFKSQDEALGQLNTQAQQQAQVASLLENSQKNYQSLGELKPAAELQKELEGLQVAEQAQTQSLREIATRLSQLDVKKKPLQFELAKLSAELTAQAANLQKLQENLAGLKGQFSVAHEAVPEAWRSITMESYQQQQAEFQTLTSGNIEQHHLQLAQSRSQVTALQAQHASIQEELNAIPEAARLAAPEAERLIQQATAQRKQAEQAHQTARDQHLLLQRQAKAYADIVQQIAVHERQSNLFKKLEEKLGKKGLQLAMMDDAQQQIVGFARQTLLQLTSHTLSLELHPPTSEGAEEALDLCVRDTENTQVTPMEYLSGSQKFRVAIAIALAIGRYSAGQARPLESVIIDEGFGSLDRDGLQAMADELKELQKSQLLRRIILVSHQEDFVDRFPVGYRLFPTENGTVVEVKRG